MDTRIIASDCLKVKSKIPVVHFLFDQIADNLRDQLALIEREHKISYLDLKRKSDAYAQALMKLGVQPRDTVAIFMHRSIEFVAALLGILKTYANYLPLDPHAPLERNRCLIEKSNVRRMVTQPELQERAFEFIGENNCLITNQVCFETYFFKAPEIPSLETSFPLYIIFTSGSTGEPKGVIGSHEALINRVSWMAKTYSFQENEVLCQKTSVSFVDHVAEIFQALLNGLPLVIIPDKDVRDVIKLVESIHKHSITRIVLVPSLLNMLLYLPEEYMKKLSTLKFIFSSGETLTKKLADECHKKLPHVRLINIYGSSEVSADVTHYEDHSYVAERVKQLFTPLEKPHFHMQREDLFHLQGQFLSTNIPEYGEPFSSYQSFLTNEVTPFAVNVSAPTFVGHMTSGIPSCFGKLSKYLTELNQNLVKMETSTVFTFLENQSIGMLHSLIFNQSQAFYIEHLKNPSSCLGLSLNGGSLANIQALHIARYNALLKCGAMQEDIQQIGFDALLRQLGFASASIIVSPLMHYSIKKACLALGIGMSQISYIPLNNEGKLDITRLDVTIDELKKKNILIIAVIGIAGGTETGSVDPLDAMAQILSKHKIYFHVDAAWGGPFLFSDRLKNKLSGIEQADSVTICGHKQLCLPMGTSALLLKDPSLLTPLQVNANYQARKESWDLGKFALVGSKPASSTYFHAGFRILGRSGYRYLVENGYQHAQFFSKLIRTSQAFELIKEPDLNIVNYRYIPAFLRDKKKLNQNDQNAISEATKKIQHQQFIKGKTFVSFTELPPYGPFVEKIGVFRAVFLNPLTQYSDLVDVLNEQLSIAEKYLDEKPQEKIDVRCGEEVMSVPIGYPIDQSAIYLLDSQLKRCSVGEIGEIYVGGKVLSLGYIGQDPYPEEIFKSNPTNPSELLYKTGDFGRFLPNGAIEFLGRNDQRVKIKGCRIELMEVENALLTIEELDRACVLCKEQEHGSELIAIYSTKNFNNSLNLSEIKSKLSQRLPDYMIPSQFHHIELFPMLINGKINRRALLEKIQSRG